MMPRQLCSRLGVVLATVSIAAVLGGCARTGASGATGVPAALDSGGATTSLTASTGTVSAAGSGTLFASPAPPGGPAGTASAAPTPPAAPSPLVSPSGSGAYGYVTAGPTCPVERPDHPCPPRPVSARVDAEDGSGRVVASTHTDQAGRYSLGLAPGSYTLVAVTGSTFPRCPPASVTVRPGAATRADIACDTGIR